MKTRVFLGVSAAALLGLASSIVVTFTAIGRAQTPAQKTLGPTIPAPAPTPARTGGPELEVRLLGAISARDENDDDEPDDVFVRPTLRGGPMRATGSAASSGGDRPADASQQTGGGGGPTSLSSHPNAAKWIEQALQKLRGNEVDVTLLGSHKYMLNDCLGIKVSAGTFKLRLAEPKIYFQGTALIFECGIDKIDFSAIKLRMRPRVPSLTNPNPCKFSKKFEVGGSADDVRLKLKMDPIVDLQHCKFYSSILPETTVRIGNLNLKPLQNNLDQMAKNAVEDALTAFLNFQFYDQITRVFDDMIEADCPGGDVRRAIDRNTGGGGGGGAGGTAGAGGADIAALTQRVQQLETRVAALEQRPAGAGGTAQAATAGTPASKAKATPAATRPTVASKSGPQNIPGVNQPTIHEQEPCCAIVANPELKGRLGRIVVAYPAGAAFKNSSPRTDIFRAGEAKSLRTDYGNLAVEMTPGTYELTIGGQKVSGVVVEARRDTVVKVGVLHLNASGNTRFDVFPAAGKTALQTRYGASAIGLPPGTYEVEVNGQRESVTVRAGAITEY